jgi:hypothetical protein
MRFVRAVIIVLLIVVTGAGLYNVYAANDAVRELAQTAACPDRSDPVCRIHRIERTPFSQSFEFQNRGGVINVRCTRAAIFVGAYACARDGTH